MMGDQVEGFVEGLIEKTREGKLDWKPFSSFKNRRDILEELENGRGDFDYATNSIKESKSYFLQSGEGFVFLFEIYHGDPQVASPLDNTIGLMVKINSVLPLNSLLGYTEMMQEEMEKAQEELNEREYTTSAGGGMVECTINGKKELIALNIKKEAVDPDDVEILQDMIIGAVNEAIRKAEEVHAAEMEKITNGLSLPGIF